MMATYESGRGFGRYLQACRRAKGISLETVSRQTKITMTCLRQIESEDLAHLPAPVFVTGFLRAYATAIGADAQEAVRRYETARTGRAQNERACAQPQPHSGAKFWYRFVLAYALLAAVICATLYMDNRLQHRASPATEPTVPEADKTLATTSPPTESPPIAQEPKAPAPQAAETERSAPQDRLRLAITAVAPTWLKVIADAQAPQEYMLQPQDQISLEAKNNFSLLIGNAEGVRLTLNGRPVTVPGSSGQVVTLQLP